MSIEILRLNLLTPLQILAKAMDEAEPEDSVVVCLFKEKDTRVLITYSAIRPGELALASVELAEIARNHGRT